MKYEDKLKKYPTPADYLSKGDGFYIISSDDDYMRAYAPDHPLSSESGILIVARHFFSVSLGRWLKPGEKVHYKDGNRENINPDNLEIVTDADLGRMRANKVLKFCELPSCKQPFEVIPSHADLRRCCCEAHSGLRRRKFNPSKEELEHMVWQMPLLKLAQIYGVSDVAVGKRCRKMDIRLPGVGYWQKIESIEREQEVKNLTQS